MQRILYASIGGEETAFRLEPVRQTYDLRRLQ